MMNQNLTLQKQAIVDPGKCALHDLESDRVTIVAVGAAAGVGAIALYLGFGANLDTSILTVSGCGDPPAPIDVTAINMNLTYVRNDLDSLSLSSMLAITNLKNTTTSILGCLNGSIGLIGCTILLAVLSILRTHPGRCWSGLDRQSTGDCPRRSRPIYLSRAAAVIAPALPWLATRMIGPARA
jgi:hypothetical protein